MDRITIVIEDSILLEMAQTWCYGEGCTEIHDNLYNRIVKVYQPLFKCITDWDVKVLHHRRTQFQVTFTRR